MTTVHFESTTAARAHLKDLLDAAADGRTATLTRDGRRAAVIDAERLRRALAATITAEPVIVAEAGQWSAFFGDLPISASGMTLDEAVADLITALREYAEDWTDHLRLAPNHRDNWALVQLIDLSTDAELEAWVTGA